MSDFSEIFSYAFVQNAFLAGSLIAVISPLLGIFLVTRRYSALADTLAHVSLVGVAGALVLSVNALIGAVISTLVVTFGVDKISKSKIFYPESILILFISSSLGVVSIFSAQNPLVARRLEGFLFGSILTTSSFEVLLTLILGLVSILLLVTNFRSLMRYSFDPDQAKVKGLNIAWLEFVLAVTSALVISLGIQVVGGLLISSLIVVPVMSASNFKLGFSGTAMMSVGISLLAVWFGLVLSFLLNLPSGGVIVMLNLGLFLVSFGLGKLVN
jgi:zinc transport system permease protein